MPLRALLCPQCRAPLPPRARLTTVVCEHCGAAVSPDRERVRAADFRAALERLQQEGRAAPVTVAGVPYRLLGRVAEGAHAEVLLAERAARISERVVLKVLRSAAHAERLAHEWKVLTALQESTAQGASLMSQWLPQPVALGGYRDGSAQERPALVVRARSGFVHTLEHVRAVYPEGVDPRHATWMWRRLLDLLGWVHRAGWAHGHLEPGHVLLHARDHGAMLVGWSQVRACTPALQREDLAASARCMRRVLEGAAVPAPLESLLAACAGGHLPEPDAWALNAQVAAAAREAWGAPRFLPFSMPGWP
jgi:Lipopolysaccharide kinase (Kdo/WaaP) family